MRSVIMLCLTGTGAAVSIVDATLADAAVKESATAVNVALKGSPSSGCVWTTTASIVKYVNNERPVFGSNDVEKVTRVV